MRILSIENKVRTQRYLSREGLFVRRQCAVAVETNPWLLAEEDAIVWQHARNSARLFPYPGHDFGAQDPTARHGSIIM